MQFGHDERAIASRLTMKIYRMLRGETAPAAPTATGFGRSISCPSLGGGLARERKPKPVRPAISEIVPRMSFNELGSRNSCVAVFNRLVCYTSRRAAGAVVHQVRGLNSGLRSTFRREVHSVPDQPFGPNAAKLFCRLLRIFGKMKRAVRVIHPPVSDPEVRIGQSTREATLLIKVAAEVALYKCAVLSIFGRDHPTPGRNRHSGLYPPVA